MQSTATEALHHGQRLNVHRIPILGSGESLRKRRFVQHRGEGTIPHHKVGSHRRVLAHDVLAFQETQRQAQAEALDEMTALAEEVKLYDAPPLWHGFQMESYFVVLDANVLCSATLRETMMWLSPTDLFKARWTDDIHNKWTSAFARRGYDRSKFDRLRDLMDQHAVDAKFIGYEALLPTLTHRILKIVMFWQLPSVQMQMPW